MEERKEMQEQEAVVDLDQPLQSESSRLVKPKKKCSKKKVFVILAIVLGGLLLAVGGYFLTKLWILPELQYQKALKALEEEDYKKAYDLFEGLEDYKDAQEYLERFEVVRVSYERSFCVESWNTTSHTLVEGEVDPYGVFTQITTTKWNEENGETQPSQTNTEKADVTFTYNKDGLPVRADHFDGRYATFRHNDDGDLVLREVFDENGNLMSCTEFTYNKNGDKTLVKEFGPDGQELSRRVYTYNDQGDRIREEYSTEDYRECVTIRNVYDKKGNILESERTTVENDDPTTTMCIVIRFNERGDLTESCSYRGFPDESLVRRTICTYDDRGNLIKEINTVEGSYGLEQTKTYTYDQKDRLLGIKEIQKSKPDGKKERIVTTETTIEYDKNGNMKAAEQTVRYSGGGKHQEDYDVNYAANITTYKDGDVKTVICKITYPDDAKKNSELRQYYDENGFLEKEELENGNGTLETTECKYAYFYYPEGVCRPLGYAGCFDIDVSIDGRYHDGEHFSVYYFTDCLGYGMPVLGD